VFFLFSDFGADLYGRVLTDLRSAGASFHSSSVALPLTELTFRELERSSFLDSPFHSFFRQQVIRVGENGRVVSSAYQCHTQNLPQNVLSKTFVEVSLALRFQPPPELTYVVENLLTLVLQLRVAEEDGIVPVDFYSALDLYSRKHPARADYLKQALGSLLSLPQPQEAIFWAEVDAALARLSPSAGRRASALAAQISPLRVTDSKAEWRGPKATDLWIQLSPFLRLEMNAMRERYLEIPGVFRV